MIRKHEHLKSGAVNLHYIYDSIEDFFGNHDKIDEEARGDPSMITETIEKQKEEKKSFKGLDNATIVATKYGYTEGVAKLEEMTGLEHISGGSKFSYKWDEYDGDDMSMERLYDGIPAMRKRYRTKGGNTGKFVDLYVNIDESAGVGYEDMLWKTYAAVKIVDELESMGIRTGLHILSGSGDSGYITIDGQEHEIKKLVVEIPVKEYNDPANLSLFCSVLSPWFFRHYMFIHFTAKYRATPGLGYPEKTGKPDERGNIYIDKGECLSEEAAEEKIKSVSEMLNS